MKIELDARGLRIEIVWKSTMAALKALLPLVTALLAILSAPEIVRLGTLLGWW